MVVFSVQLTTSRIGNLTRLIHNLAICVTIHTCRRPDSHTSYVLSFRMVFFYLVTTGWIFYIRLYENSINHYFYYFYFSFPPYEQRGGGGGGSFLFLYCTLFTVHSRPRAGLADLVCGICGAHGAYETVKQSAWCSKQWWGARAADWMFPGRSHSFRYQR